MKTSMLTLDIAKDFSPSPIGRYKSDSPTSGEVFRQEKLIPALQEAESVVVVLDGADGFGSSFLEEAFGGLVRSGVHPEDALHRLRFVSEEDPTLISEIQGYIRDAIHRQSDGIKGKAQ